MQALLRLPATTQKAKILHIITYSKIESFTLSLNQNLAIRQLSSFTGRLSIFTAYFVKDNRFLSCMQKKSSVICLSSRSRMHIQPRKQNKIINYTSRQTDIYMGSCSASKKSSHRTWSYHKMNLHTVVPYTDRLQIYLKTIYGHLKHIQQIHFFPSHMKVLSLVRFIILMRSN